MDAPLPADGEHTPGIDHASLEAMPDTEHAKVNDGDDDASLLAEFTGLIECPNYLRQNFREMEADRKYVSQDILMSGTQDAVTTNHVLRNQYVGLSYLGVAAPEPFVQPCRTVGAAYATPVKRFAETMEVHLSRMAKQMRLGEKMDGACQDAYTNGIAWLKVTLQADYMHDPIGRARFNDQQDSVAAYLALKSRMEAGDIQEDSADWKRYQDLDATLRTYAAGKLEEQIREVPVMVPGPVPAVDALGQPVIDSYTGQPVMVPGMIPDPTDPREVQRTAIINGQPFDILGMPEVEHAVTFACDQIQPEDMRWDWSVTRPEDFIDCDWMAHRVFMWPRDVFAKFQGVTAADLNGVTLYDDKGNALESQFGISLSDKGAISTKYGGETSSESLDPTLRPDLETTQVNGRMAVWELWHKRLGRRYVFVPGAKRFLINEVPQAVGRRWFPFFAIYFNRVTGAALPLSDVKLQRSAQDEYNTLRSHEREARRAGYPTLFTPKNLMDKAAKDAYRNRLPFSVIEVDRPEEVAKYLKESVQTPFNAEMFTGGQSKALNDLASMAGIPQIMAGGNSNEDLASAVALAKEGMETGVSRRRILANRVVTDIFEYVAEISVRVFSSKTIQATCGMYSVWPRLTVEELYTQLAIEVKGGLSGQPRAKDRIDLWMNFATVAQSLGLPVNGAEVLRELLEAMGLRTDLSRFILPPEVLAQQQQQAAGRPAPGGGAPEQQGPQGEAGGAPTMVERGAPTSLDQVPNHPPQQMPETPAPPPGA